MAEYDTLTRKQKRAIPALLAARTIADAAALAGVTVRTMHRYLADGDFRAALAAAETDAINAASRRLVAGQQEALDTLQELLQSATSENVRRAAASDWLNNAMRLRELATLENRLSALEAIYGIPKR